ADPAGAAEREVVEQAAAGVVQGDPRAGAGQGAAFGRGGVQRAAVLGEDGRAPGVGAGVEQDNVVRPQVLCRQQTRQRRLGPGEVGAVVGVVALAERVVLV